MHEIRKAIDLRAQRCLLINLAAVSGVFAANSKSGVEFIADKQTHIVPVVKNVARKLNGKSLTKSRAHSENKPNQHTLVFQVELIDAEFVQAHLAARNLSNSLENYAHTNVDTLANKSMSLSGCLIALIMA